MNEKGSNVLKTPEYKITSAGLDRYVDTRNVPYGEAYTHFGVTPDEVDFSNDHDTLKAPQMTADFETKPLIESERGPSLSLLGRARALDIIMLQFSQENKTQGAEFSRDYNGMERRYRIRTDEVIGNMRGKASRMGAEAVRAIDILAGGDSDVSPDLAPLYGGVIESSLRKEFGPGNADSRKREKLMTKVYRTAGTTKAKQRRQP